MKKRTLDIRIPDEDFSDIDAYMDGSLLIDESFVNFSILASSFYKRYDKDVYQKLMDRIEFDIDVILSIDDDVDASLEKQLLNDMKNSKPVDFFNTFDSFDIHEASDNFLKTIIENNLSFFNNKNYILPNTYGIGAEDVKKVKNDIKRIRNLVPSWKGDFLIRVYGNTLPVTVDEYFKSFEVMQSIVSKIKTLNLSPLETIMFVYDIVKKRSYKKEDRLEDAYNSRDFTTSLLGDKIVCVGFNIIFDTILNLLGISYIPISLDGLHKGESGHVRTCIYVDDPKYNVKGHYFFDVTWDSGVDYVSANSYRFFMKTLSEMVEADREAGLYMSRDRFLYPNFIYQSFRDLSDDYSYSEFVESGGSSRFNQYLNNLGEPSISIGMDHNNKSDLISAYKRIYDSFSESINPLDFANLLYNVKRIEYYLDPDSTPFSAEDLASSILGNTFSRFNRNEKELNLLSNILHISPSEIEKKDKEELLRATITPELKRDIAAIKLIKTLSDSLKK